jgi:Secretory lipase
MPAALKKSGHLAMAVVLLVTALSASSCSGKDDARKQDSDQQASPGAGSLIKADPLPAVAPRLSEVTSLADRITYMSTSGIDDADDEVSGSVFVPKGDPPPGGWPMIAYGHRATGFLSQCAPSLSPTLMGESDTVAELVKAGYVVSVPDYQGLGSNTTYHPFLDSTTEGYNLIDSLSAIRKLVPDTALKWIAVGTGQGGQAAWAANELVDNHGMGLELVGAVSVSPTADVVGLADAAAAGTLTTEQKLTLVSVLAALASAYGDNFDLDKFRRGAASANWDDLLSCDADASDQRIKLAEQLGPDDLRPDSPDAVELLRGFLNKSTLPQGPTAAPMLVIFSGRDPVIPREWTDQALGRACAMGDVIQIQFRPDETAGDIDIANALGWMSDRVQGSAAPDDCGSTTGTGTQSQVGR